MGNNASTSPDEPIEPGTDGTPAQPPEGQAPEQAAPPAADGTADKATSAESLRIAQAEYTRAQQTFAALKAELGLDPKATRDEVTAAVLALKSKPATADGEGEEAEVVDPRVAEAELRAWNAEMRWQATLHGEDLTNGVIELVNLARSGTNDPEALVTAFAGFVDEMIAKRAPAAPATEPDTGQPAAPEGTPGGIGLSEGDATPPVRQNPPTSGRPEPGTVQAIRGLFQRAVEERR